MVQHVIAKDEWSTTQTPMKLEAEPEPEPHSHIVTSIVSPAGQDKTTHIEPQRYCGKKNIAGKGCVYSQS